MKLLIDNALSPIVAVELNAKGLDAIHVRDIGLQHASDGVIFEKADALSRVIVSADTDFGTLLALRQTSSPSVILWRRSTPRRPDAIASLLASVIADRNEDLLADAVVVVGDVRLRVRRLPIARRSVDEHGAS